MSCNKLGEVLPAAAYFFSGKQNKDVFEHAISLMRPSRLPQAIFLQKLVFLTFMTCNKVCEIVRRLQALFL